MSPVLMEMRPVGETDADGGDVRPFGRMSDGTLEQRLRAAERLAVAADEKAAAAIREAVAATAAVNEIKQRLFGYAGDSADIGAIGELRSEVRAQGRQNWAIIGLLVLVIIGILGFAAVALSVHPTGS